jgi:hypothetical protein
VDETNRIEIKYVANAVPFYELIGARIVRLRVNFNGSDRHLPIVSMILEKDGRIYEIEFQGDVIGCNERRAVKNNNSMTEEDQDGLSFLGRVFQKFINSKDGKENNSKFNDKIIFIERKGEVVIKRV